MSGLHFAPFLSGFGLGLSLIAAIGAQNAFILRQGLMRAHVFVLCLICALADAVLIVAGVAGLGSLVAQSPALITGVTVGGAIFLLGYAALAFRRALRPGILQAVSITRRAANLWSGGDGVSRLHPSSIPHVYSRYVVRAAGGLSAAFEGTPAPFFGISAAPVVASFVWFFAARHTAPVVLRRSYARTCVRAQCSTRPSSAIMVLIRAWGWFPPI